MFDWCNAGQHETCPVEYQRWYHGKVKKGRKNVDGIIFLDEFAKCDCKCHSPEKSGKKTTKKPVRRTRRKT